jgi:soluble cytochrome b562
LIAGEEIMTDMISAALTTFVTAAKSIVSVRKAISSFSNLLNDGQIDQLKKAVRAIYFFQDGFISDIDRLLSRRSDKRAVAKSIRERLDRTEEEVAQAIAVLERNTVKTNLRLELEEISTIRNIANIKNGIRQHLRNVVSVLETKQSLRGLTMKLKEIRAQIKKICLEIDKIEKLLDRRGLQKARESFNG